MLGIRPEELRFDRTSGIRVKVGRSEFVGAEALVEVLLNDDRMIVKTGVMDIPEAGTEVGLHFDMTRARLFDTRTGQSLNLQA